MVINPDGAKAIYNSSGLAYYRHSDWLGSSRLTSTASRTMYSSAAYAPFGEQYANVGTADASFTSQDQDNGGGDNGGDPDCTYGWNDSGVTENCPVPLR